jgi:L-asparagine permease
MADDEGALHKEWVHSLDSGYHQALNRRQIQMIGIGGAIGTGLFLGASGRLQIAGPALALVYGACGFFCFFILRALGELVMYRPTAGSFVSYAREFLGEKASYVAGWMFFLNWAHAGIVDITAVALYMHYWGTFADVPQWVFAAIALAFVGGMNLMAVKWFGEMEFWFSLIKVVALVIFLLVAGALLVSGHGVGGVTPGMGLISANGGIFPHGVLPAIVIVQGVVFAYAGIELVGTAAGEAENPRAVLPGAINNVIWRIVLFYVGSVFLLVMLLPWTAYRAGVSPFVTFFGALGVPGIGSVMNLVVLTAALSSLNSGLYSTGRVLRSLAMGGSAPKYVSRMNAAKVPYSGILVTLVIYAFGVLLNYLVPGKVFEIVLNISSLGVVSTWAFIVICQMKLRAAQNRGEIARVDFRMPGGRVMAWLTLAFLAGVVVLMALDWPIGTYTIAGLPILGLLLGAGWWMLKGTHPFAPAAPSYIATRAAETDDDPRT